MNQIKNALYYYRRLIIAIIFSILAAYACSRTTLAADAQATDSSAAAGACDYTQADMLIVLDADYQAIDNVSIDKLGQVDRFLRDVYQSREWLHVLGYFTTNEQVNQYLGLDRDWAGYSGLTTLDKFSLETCTPYTERFITSSWISLMRSGVFDDATLFGLFVHEISHASGGTSDVDEYRSAVYWERVGKTAYLDACGTLSYTDRDDCLEIQTILESE